MNQGLSKRQVELLAQKAELRAGEAKTPAEREKTVKRAETWRKILADLKDGEQYVAA